MSVYTEISPTALADFLQRYDIGQAADLRGISAGIENSNFFLDTSQGQYVLTIFERVGREELPYFLDLTAFLGHRDVPCPQPIADRQGHYLQTLCNKPAAIVQKLSGATLSQPTATQSATAGALLGRMHSLGQDFPERRQNPSSPQHLIWHRQMRAALTAVLTSDQRSLLDDELAFLQTQHLSALPQGVIHGDLFPDNALFNGERLSGVIDFYYAADDCLLYDLAISVNAWCSQADGQLDMACCQRMQSAYQQQRPLSVAETAHWFVLLRAAALRFWLSRLYDWHFPRDGDLTHRKDPEEYQRILQARRAGR